MLGRSWRCSSVCGAGETSKHGWGKDIGYGRERERKDESRGHDLPNVRARVINGSKGSAVCGERLVCKVGGSKAVGRSGA